MYKKAFIDYLKSMKFKIVVPSYNCADWLQDCLQSIEDQTYKNYDVMIIDDASKDLRQREVIDQFVRKNGWQALYNELHQGAMANIVQGIRLLQCSPNDVIVILDGDDWFYNAEVLSKLNAVYSTGTVDLTYGQFIYYPMGWFGCNPVPDEVIEQRSYRRAYWRTSHPRTFKHYLWNAIRDEDLRDERGCYVPSACDMAMMFPMLEMAGPRLKFMEDVLYVYNVANPLNDHKVDRKLQLKIEWYLRQKPKYDLLLMDNS